MDAVRPPVKNKYTIYSRSYGDRRRCTCSRKNTQTISNSNKPINLPLWYEELSCVFDEIDQSGDGYTGGAKRVLRVPGLVCTLVLRAELIKPSPED